MEMDKLIAVGNKSIENLLKCLFCPYHTSNSNTYRTHMVENHSEFTGFPCLFCDSQFLHMVEFESHLHLHHQSDESNFEYRPEITRLMPFIPTKNENGQYCCSQCDFKTDQSQQMRPHVMFHFNQSQDIRSGEANEAESKMVSDGKMGRYIDENQDEPRSKKPKNGVFCCPMCDYCSTFTHNVLRHGRNVHQIEVKPRPATTEEEANYFKQVAGSDNLTKSQEIGTAKCVQAPIQCHHLECSFSSDNAQALHVHQFKSHDGRDLKVFTRNIHLPASSSNSYECHLCDFKDTNKNQFQMHLNKHVDGFELFSCDKRDSKTLEGDKFKGDLMEHQRRNRCYQCPFVANDLDELRFHKTKHEGQTLSFNCDVCTKTFESEDELESHLIQIHGFTLTGVYEPNYDGVKNISSYDDGHISDEDITPDMEVIMFCPLVDPADVISCGFCSVTLGGTSHYKTHIKMRHPDKVEEVEATYAINIPKDKGYEARPYSCNRCDYSAGNKIDMLYHRYSHEGIKLFACELCEYECHFPSGLRNHRLSKHAEVSFDRIRLDARSIQQYYEEAKLRKARQAHV